MTRRLLEPLHEDHVLVARFERALGKLLEGRRCFELTFDELVLPVQFAELFLGAYHQHREDCGLFATLRELRRRGRDYPAYEMHEHDELSAAIVACKHAVHGAAPDAHARYVHLLREFHGKLVAHRMLEDGVIFPQLERALSAEDAALIRTNLAALIPHGAEVVQHSTLLLERMEALVGREVPDARPLCA